MIRSVILYLLFWILLSERIRIESIAIGSVICLLVVLFNVSILGKAKERRLTVKKAKLWIKYIATLLKEILISNINVAIVVLSPKMKISPTVVTFKTKLKDDFYKTVLANSITLTPGTLTVTMQDDELTIHCLEEKYAKGLSDSEFEKILMKVEE